MDKANLRRIIAEVTEQMVALHEVPLQVATTTLPPGTPLMTPVRQGVVIVTQAGSGTAAVRTESTEARSGVAVAAAGRPKSAVLLPRKK